MFGVDEARIHFEQTEIHCLLLRIESVVPLNSGTHEHAQLGFPRCASSTHFCDCFPLQAASEEGIDRCASCGNVFPGRLDTILFVQRRVERHSLLGMLLNVGRDESLVFCRKKQHRIDRRGQLHNFLIGRDPRFT